jgi:hypothetical protein
MTIPRFSEDEDKEKINLVEWLRMVKEHCKDPFQAIFMLDGESYKWWRTLNEYTRLCSTR